MCLLYYSFNFCVFIVLFFQNLGEKSHLIKYILLTTMHRCSHISFLLDVTTFDLTGQFCNVYPVQGLLADRIYVSFSSRVGSQSASFTRRSSECWLRRWFNGKESTCQCLDTRDVSSIPASGRSPGGGNGNPLQYSCLEDSMDREAWLPTVQGVTKTRTQMSTQEYHMP